MKIFLIVFILIVVLFIVYKFYVKKSEQLDNKFYDIDIYEDQHLENIYQIHDQILKELADYEKSFGWTPWSEKYLYDSKNKKWDIIPLIGFGVRIEKILKLMPTLTKFLDSLQGLKVAIISRTSPGTKLTPHKGWAFHSNNVLRCHYGLDVQPNSCTINVEDEKFYHKTGEWIVFDDSKLHWSENNGDKDRIVLIVDIDRPENIKKGTSDVQKSEELENTIKYFSNI